jgi:hypothetical protein
VIDTSRIRLVLIGVLGLAMSHPLPAPAQTTVQMVRFTTPAGDAVPGAYFDRATSIVDRLDPNRLLIGLNRGINATTRLYRLFTASTAPFYRTAALDTVYVTVQALPGYYLSRITYTQRGTCATARTGMVAGGANWSVDGVAREISRFGSRKCEAAAYNAPYELSGSVDLTDVHRSAVSVSITSGLFAFATPNLGFASVSIASADVRIEACRIAAHECPCVGSETTGCRAVQ